MNLRRQLRNAPSCAGIAWIALAFFGATGACAATAFNARSPLGVNLQPVNYFTSEQPFLNIFKTTWISKSNPQGWQTHRDAVGAFDTGEGVYVQTDANGYPTTLAPSSGDPNRAPFSSVGVIFLYNLSRSNAGTGPSYPGGHYVVLYDGEGTLSYRNDAKLISASPGREVFDVATPTYKGGIDLRITATDPHHTGNYLRNIRVVREGQELQLKRGAIFDSTFLDLLKRFRVLRGMQWLQIDDAGGLVAHWPDRPHLSDAGWGTIKGTPLEVLLELCNATEADCWVNIPHVANDDYITQMARLVHSVLGARQKVYVELSNEVWNSDYGQFAYAKAQGRLLWPDAGSKATYVSNWYGRRSAQTCDTWKSVWGPDASRIVCVMGAQAAVPGTATEALNCPLWKGVGNAPCWRHGINAIAIAPYFAYVRAPASWTAAPDGGLKALFGAIFGGDLQATAAWVAAYQKALAPYHLPLIAYEGGQTLVSSAGPDPTGTIKNLYITANRDPRMGFAYLAALNDWKANGGQLYTIFADISQPGKYGEWGALESLWDTVAPLSDAPPKWQAIQNFINENSCWWPGCVGSIGDTAAAKTHPP